MDLQKEIENFLNLVREVENDYVYNSGEVNTLDKLTQDYLHDIELGNMDYKARAKIATKLRDTRQKRRKCKDKTLIYYPFVEYVKNHKNSINDLKNVLGSVRKEAKAQSNRVYIRKVDNAYVTEKYTKTKM